jgi:hypothetical protein
VQLAVECAATARAERAASARLAEDNTMLQDKLRVAVGCLGDSRVALESTAAQLVRARGAHAAAAAALAVQARGRAAAAQRSAELECVLAAVQAVAVRRGDGERASHAELAAAVLHGEQLRAHCDELAARGEALREAYARRGAELQLLRKVQAQKEQHIATLLKEKHRLTDAAKRLSEAALVRRHAPPTNKAQPPSSPGRSFGEPPRTPQSQGPAVPGTSRSPFAASPSCVAELMGCESPPPPPPPAEADPTTLAHAALVAHVRRGRKEAEALRAARDAALAERDRALARADALTVQLRNRR